MCSSPPARHVISRRHSDFSSPAAMLTPATSTVSPLFISYVLSLCFSTFTFHISSPLLLFCSQLALFFCFCFFLFVKLQLIPLMKAPLNLSIENRQKKVRANYFLFTVFLFNLHYNLERWSVLLTLLWLVAATDCYRFPVRANSGRWVVRLCGYLCSLSLAGFAAISAHYLYSIAFDEAQFPSPFPSLLCTEPMLRERESRTHRTAPYRQGLLLLLLRRTGKRIAQWVRRRSGFASPSRSRAACLI